jgi:uncharacterized protein YegL
MVEYRHKAHAWDMPFRPSRKVMHTMSQPVSNTSTTLVYIMVDASETMKGEKLHSVAQAIKKYANEVGKNPETNASTRFRVITFGDTVTSGALTPPAQLPLQSFTAQQNRSLGAALTTLAETIKTDYIPGSRRPLVFLLVSGNPTDDINAGVNAINTLEPSRRPRVILVNLNASVTLSLLKDVALYSYDVTPATAEAIGAFFDDHAEMVIKAATGAITNFFKSHEGATGGARPGGKGHQSGAPQNPTPQNKTL